MAELNFEQLVGAHYESLFRFALSLAQREAEAWDLVQQTFLLWAKKSHQLRDVTKAKSWLFTSLHREFLGTRRRENRFPHFDVADCEQELAEVASLPASQLDAAAVLSGLAQVDEIFRAPLALFYLDDLSYVEIAEVLQIPIGTVMSRLARGKTRLRRLLESGHETASGKITAAPTLPSVAESHHG